MKAEDRERYPAWLPAYPLSIRMDKHPSVSLVENSRAKNKKPLRFILECSNEDNIVLERNTNIAKPAPEEMELFNQGGGLDAFIGGNASRVLDLLRTQLAMDGAMAADAAKRCLKDVLDRTLEPATNTIRFPFPDQDHSWQAGHEPDASDQDHSWQAGHEPDASAISA